MADLDPEWVARRIYSEAGGLADAVAAHKDEIVALFREIDGFQSYTMVSTGTASAASITVYDDKAGVEASSQVAREWITANLPGLSMSAPEVLVGEVTTSA